MLAGGQQQPHRPAIRRRCCLSPRLTLVMLQGPAQHAVQHPVGGFGQRSKSGFWRLRRREDGIVPEIHHPVHPTAAPATADERHSVPGAELATRPVHERGLLGDAHQLADRRDLKGHWATSRQRRHQRHDIPAQHPATNRRPLVTRVDHLPRMRRGRHPGRHPDLRRHPSHVHAQPGPEFPGDETYPVAFAQHPFRLDPQRIKQHRELVHGRPFRSLGPEPARDPALTTAAAAIRVFPQGHPHAGGLPGDRLRGLHVALLDLVRTVRVASDIPAAGLGTTTWPRQPSGRTSTSAASVTAGWARVSTSTPASANPVSSHKP
jgi:hypothetical protein